MVKYTGLIVSFWMAMVAFERHKITEDFTVKQNLEDSVKTDSTPDLLTKIHSQVVNDAILWNDSLSLDIDCSYLSAQFSKVKTKKKPELYDMLPFDSILYVNKSEFQKYDSGECRLLRIVFDDTITQVSIDNKRITRYTSINELKHLFEDCHELSDIKLYGDTTQYKSCLIRSKYKDLGLLVLVKKGIIFKIDIYEAS